MTIYALSSGQGISGIAVIRLSGKNCKKILEKLIGPLIPEPRVATLRKINKINTSELIDEGLILWFPGPESYTGEDMVEFHVHGSKAVIEAMHKSLSEVENCRLASPGEFTKLAFQNGKLNLLKAESIADLITAETEIQRKQAVKIMEGKSSQEFNSIRKKLLKILSYIEAKIDFPDEDLPLDIVERIKITSNEILKRIEKILDDQKIGEIIREGFKIAIIGPPNVGKSSLINYLANRDVAIVSEIEGTTRDVIETHLNLDGYPVILSDTAGIRKSKNEIEKKGIKLALKKAEDADLKLILIDPKNVEYQRFFDDMSDKNSLLVLNKVDLASKKIIKKIKKKVTIEISVKQNLNIDKLIKKIKNKIKNKFLKSEDILITRERHRFNLQQCCEYLKSFQKKNQTKDFDKAAEDLRLATRHLGMIVGKVDVEEILSSIFNDFCIGK